MEISIWGLVLSLLLLVVPIGAAHLLGLRLGGKIFVAVSRMLISIGLLSGAYYFVVRHDSIALSILFAVVLVLLSSLAVIRSSRVGLRTYLVPVLAGVSLSSLSVAVYLILAVLSVGDVLSPRYFIPMTGVLASGSVLACSGALSAYHAGMRNHSRLYYYLIGNGATHAEALDHFMRRAMEKAMMPGLVRMAVTVVSSAPAVMWSMVAAGVDVFTAAAFQVALTIAIFATSVLSVLVTLVVARRYTIDEYSRLKPMGLSDAGKSDTENGPQSVSE